MMRRMSTEANAPPRRRRWWVRVLRWLFMLLVLFTAALGSAAWWIWQHPTETARMVLQRVDSPLRPDVAKLQVVDGEVRLDDLKLLDPISGTQVVTLRQVLWKPDLDKLKSKQLGSLKLTGLNVEANSPLLQRLQAWMNEAKVASSPSTGVRFDDVSLEDAIIKLAATPSTPAIEFKLDQSTENINFADPAKPSIGHFTVNLHDVKVGQTRLPEAHSEGSLTDGTLHITQLVLKNGVVSPSSEVLALFVPKPTTTQPEPPTPPIIKHIKLSQVKLVEYSLEARSSGAPLPDWWPPLSGRADIALQDISYDETGKLLMGSMQIHVRDLKFAPPDGKGLITADDLKVTVERLADDGLLFVQSATILHPRLDWNQGLEDYLLGATTPAPSATPSARTIRGVIPKALSIDKAQLSLTRTTRSSYQGQATLDFDAKNLRFDDHGMTSTEAQTLKVHDLTIAEHPADRAQPSDTFFEFKEGTLVIVPDDWTKRHSVTELTLTKPTLRATPENVSWFKPKPPTTPTEPTAHTDWSDMSFGKLELTEGRIDYAQQTSQRIELHTALEVTTDEASDTSPHQHRLLLKQIKALLPQSAQLPVANLDELEVAVDLPNVWTSKRLNLLRIKGGEIDVNDALLSLNQPTKDTAPVADKPESKNGWRVNELNIADTSATLYHIAPGLPPVKFAIDYRAADMPLAPSELAGNFDEQRIEFSDLSIHSPINPLISVADLRTIFVSFTLDGLMKQKIEKIEIISPSLYVGEDLFWYVDYCRKYAAGEPLPGASMTALASTDPVVNLTAATAPAPAPAPSSPGWKVEALQVSNGKLIIAPKGQPLAGIPRPFPFSFVSKLDSGKIEAELEIPADNYEWADPPVKLAGLSGRVLFQVPIKGVDNNLTQVFKVDSIHWKELRIDKADLSVTYDANGIYGKFNGQAYDGYVNGAFDVYLDQSYSWDGWISGKDIRSTEITRKLCPEYFLLDGKVDLVTIAQGNQSEVYQCDVKFNNTDPGKFSITGLNDMLKSLPADFEGYQQDAIRIGMETLRDFDYQKVDANARFYGREGKAAIHITGPTGSRNFDVNIYDHRLKVDKPASPTEQAATP